MKNSVKILIDSKKLSLETIKEYFIMVNNDQEKI